MSNKELIEAAAVISNSAYKRGNIAKQREVEKIYGGRFTLLTEHTDKDHSVFKDNKTGKIILSFKGTDIENTTGTRTRDLLTDVAAGFGLQGLTKRYKKSDKKADEVISKYGKDKVIFTGHSLGSTLAQDLSLKYDVESHSFQRGASHLTHGGGFRGLHPENRRKAKQNNVYYAGTPTPDVLSFAGQLNPLQNTHITEPKKLKKSEKGVLSSHSIHHHYPTNRKQFEEGNKEEKKEAIL
jgi:hypothetical protein